MPTSIIAPPSSAQSFNPASHSTRMHEEPPRFQPISHLSSSSQTPSPESQPVDLRNPILEEEDEGKEKGCEAANKPFALTGGQLNNHQTFKEKVAAMLHSRSTSKSIPTQASLSLNNTTTPQTPAEKKATSSVAEVSTPKTPTPKTPLSKRPTASIIQAKDSGIKRVLSGFFVSQPHLHSASLNIQPVAQVDGESLSTVYGPDPVLGKEHRRMSIRGISPKNSGTTVRLNTPPSPGSPASSKQTLRQPSDGDLHCNGRKQNRSSTYSAGLAIRDKLAKHKTTFDSTEKAPKYEHRRNRATSVDLEPTKRILKNSDPQLPERQIWGMVAEAGTGLKARRLSLSLPDDFLVDVVELYSEYTEQSKLVGRRGKSIGKGATANVRLMNRRGGSSGEFYAVKEFRGKSTTEKEEDYEQKVKSEFLIAKSAHHPNIVETFRLCTHNGRWNQVMEFCGQGDLFGLVSQKYLSQEEHFSDRLCLFKQLIQGLNYLHNHGIAHRDVKLENILITKDSKLKITDFGVSEVFAGIHPGVRSAGGHCGKDMSEVRLCAPGMCGSPPYVAPEVIAKNGEYDPRPLDVWGAAVVMLCMCANGVLWGEAKAGSSPLYDDLVRGWIKWNAKHEDHTALGITETDYPHVTFFDQHIRPPALRRVLLTMLNPDPAKRATMAMVAKNRWLKNVECCQVDSYDDPTTLIDASKSRANLKGMVKVVHHNHLPPSKHLGHHLVRLPGSTDMQ